MARAVFNENKIGNGAFLDATSAIGKEFPEHFPTVYKSCMDAGIDPIKDMIPISPAEHYHMGGISTDIWGRSSLEGLSAIGECASTGLHGANRLASNSLLEAVVFANRVAQSLLNKELVEVQNAKAIAVKPLANEKLQSLRLSMTENAGVIRDKQGLSELLETIENLREPNPSNEIIVASIIATAALNREESRGGHYRSDFTELKEPPKHSNLVLDKNGAINII